MNNVVIKMLPVLFVLAFFPANAMALEQPDYVVLMELDGVEYRQYSGYLVVETIVESSADYNQAANIGFRRLFDYISGDNKKQTKIAMTAPVQVGGAAEAGADGGEKIAMTAPVQQSMTENGNTGWTVSFVVPREYSLTTAPIPQGENVFLREVPGELVAVLRFSGRWTESNISRHRDALMQSLAQASVLPVGVPRSAAYNSPFMPPFLRHNEILVPVAELPLPASDTP